MEKISPCYLVLNDFRIIIAIPLGKLEFQHAINFCKIYDMFGEQAAKDTLRDVNKGKVCESTIEKYLYTDETKEEYTARLRAEYSDLD